jgi:peptidoglycan hydrolase-like protein with peptidoglycan-binding domain
MFFLFRQKNILYFLLSISIFFITVSLHAETVSGNGYSVQQVISTFQGNVSGNGYSAQQAGQEVGNQVSGGGYTAQSVFGSFATPASTPAPAPVSSGGGGSSGGGYYSLPNATTSSTKINGVSPLVSSSTLLTTNGSTCATRISISQPIDITVSNNKDDVKKLQIFLNTYEGEKLAVTGFYGKKDIEAVKRWQGRYKKEILSPMRLSKPTGTIYTLSIRQIEKQTTAQCGQEVIVSSCPFFKTYVKYGDSGPEVKKVQQFLNIVQGEKLSVNGKYGVSTRNAALRFQRASKKNIVSFVLSSFMSGNWNVSTRTKANEVIGCDILQ